MTSPTQRTVCAETRLKASSKSNMPRLKLPDRSSVAIGTAEKRFHVVPHGRFKRGEVGIVAGTAQISDVGLREVLIAATNGDRHVDVLKGRRASKRREHGGHQIAEAAGVACADVEDA